MNETENERFRREQKEDYDAWRNSTSLHPLSDWYKVLEDPNVILPENGSYYMIANSLDEIKEFLYRVESVERWMSVKILKDRYADQWDKDDDEELPDFIRIIDNPKTLSFNQFFKVEERLQVVAEDDPHEVYPVEFEEDFLEDLTFPCLVQHSGDGGADRIGGYEINHCQVLNLTGCPPREGPVKIHLRWI